MGRPIMNAELVLEAPQRVSDGGGGHTTHWAPIGTLWAEVVPAGARERLIGGREASEVSYRITVRSAPAGSPRRPTPDCRFRTGNRVFAIRGIAPLDGRPEYLTCWTVEGALA